MVDALNLCQCPVCDTFYVPETTVKGRVIPHYVLPATGLSLNQHVERAAIAMDFSATDTRVVWSLLTGGVVDPPLTGRLLDMEV